jgi:exopolyphosphatase/guanosine-5'-triphosphate,3'-diphosphate pyrophosphatase
MILAAIDIGTNTVRLLVVEAQDQNSYRILEQQQEITRLGEGLIEHGKLTPQAVERTVKLLSAYARRIAQLKVDEVCAVATSAVREAQNGKSFVEQVKQQSGLEIRVISPQREAGLALLGVQGVISSADKPLLVVDIGGGSTEFIQANSSGIQRAVSLEIGVVKLKERFLKSDPVDKLEYREMLNYIDNVLAGLDLVCDEHSLLVGIAGTATTLAAVDQKLVDYDPRLINKYRLRKERISAIQDKFLKCTIAQRRQIPGLEPGRADVIVSGVALQLCVMAKYGFDQMIVSDSGLREGIIMDRLKQYFVHKHRTGGGL